MAVKIIEHGKENPEIYKMLSTIEGFVKLYHYYNMSFPKIFNKCNVIKNNNVDVFIIEWIEYNLDIKNMTIEDKCCLLFELVYALKEAKKKYGFEHNDLHFENIRLKKDTYVRHYIVKNVEISWHSSYRCVIIDFGFASINQIDKIHLRN